jgi:hypothetical protein
MKLSKSNLKTAQAYKETIEHYALIIARHKAGCEFLPTWFTDKPVAWYEGALAATEADLTTLLMNNKCYNGFWERDVKNERFKVEYSYNDYSLGRAQ